MAKYHYLNAHLPSLDKWKVRFAITKTLFILFALFAASSSKLLAQDPGKGATRANFEIDADFKSGLIPPFWNAGNYNPTNLPIGDDWSKGATGNAVLKQLLGVSVVGITDNRNAIWQVDGNGGSNSAVAEGSTFSGTSNKNGDNIAPGQSPYLVELGGSTPQKNDITNTYLHGRTVAPGPGQTGPQLWIFYAAETRSNNGSSYMDFEYNQAGVQVVPNGTKFNLVGNGPVGGRTVNDILLVINFTGGGNRPVVGIRKWQADATWSDELSLAALEAFVTTNPTAVDPVAPNKSFSNDGAYANITAALKLVEGGVNITSLNLGASFNPCNPLSTVTIKTRSSPSYTSELKDYDILQFTALPPSDLTPFDAVTACVGNTAQFATTVSGDGASAANVQWFLGATQLSDDAKYDIVVNGNTSTLTVNNLVAGDAGTYKAKLVNATCGTPEETATLTVNTTAALTDINNQTNCPDVSESATFFTDVSGTGATAANVQWFIGATQLTNGAKYTISTSGARSTLVVNNVVSGDAATYTAKLTNAACGAPEKSATLTVNTTAALTEMTGETKCPDVGESATFFTDVSGTGATAANVQWFIGATQLTNGAKYTISTNGARSTLVVNNVVSGDAATYTAKLTGATCGAPEKTVVLTVNTTAALTNLNNVTKCPGANETAVFSTTVSGTGASAANVQWFFGATELSDGAKYDIAVSGNISTLTVSNLLEADEGTYKAKLVNATCGTPEKTATLTINPVPDADAGDDPAEQCYIAGGNPFSLNGIATNGTAEWTVLLPSQLPAGVTVGFNNAASPTPTFTVNGASAGLTLTLRLTVTSNQSPSCGSDFDDVVVKIKAQASGKDGVILPITCVDRSFKLSIASPDAGTTYTVTQPCNGAYSSTGTIQQDGSLLFTGLKFAAGYQIVASIGNCIAAPIICPGECSDICEEPTARIANPTLENKTTNSLNSIKSKLGNITNVEAVIESQSQVTAIPNPFSNKLRFSLKSDVSGRGTLELYNMVGQRVQTVFQGNIEAGKAQSIEYNVPLSQRTNLVYVFRVGNQKTTGKLISLEK